MTNNWVKKIRKLLTIKYSRNYFELYQIFHYKSFQLNNEKNTTADMMKNAQYVLRKVFNKFGVFQE